MLQLTCNFAPKIVEIKLPRMPLINTTIWYNKLTANYPCKSHSTLSARPCPLTAGLTAPAAVDALRDLLQDALGLVLEHHAEEVSVVLLLDRVEGWRALSSAVGGNGRHLLQVSLLECVAEVFRHQVGGVPRAIYFLEAQPLRGMRLLEPQALGANVSDLSDPATLHYAERSAGIRIYTCGVLEAHVRRARLYAEHLRAAGDHAVRLGFCTRQGQHLLLLGVALDDMVPNHDHSSGSRSPRLRAPSPVAVGVAVDATWPLLPLVPQYKPWSVQEVAADLLQQRPITLSRTCHASRRFLDRVLHVGAIWPEIIESRCHASKQLGVGFLQRRLINGILFCPPPCVGGMGVAGTLCLRIKGPRAADYSPGLSTALGRGIRSARAIARYPPGHPAALGGGIHRADVVASRAS